MINTFLSAKLVDYYTIKVCIFSNVEKTDYYPIKLIKNNENPTELIISKHKFLSGIQLFECKSNNKIELGNNYLISIDSFGIVPLDVSDATSFADFDEEYFYNENDLGFTYSKKKTTFKIWAPLASNVSLYIKNNDTRFITYKMSRAEKGIYFITLEGDYDSAAYRFLVTNNGISQFAADPYAKASSANGKYSYVVDLEKTKCDFFEYNLKRTNNYSSATIYELHVRDFTIDKNTDIVNKGKFLGLTEENRHTLKNNPAGIDYLKFLGITHVQLLPIFDYKTVNELKADEEYNWGYDPHQFFVPEGSYSTKPDDPYSRIVECKKMIQSLHKKGIKVNLDVVYNHVYDYSNSIFEKVVPNYYFRKNKSGLLSNGSFCGNELDSQRPMVRKLIIDSCLYWIKEYGIDGYRFDLMGLIDVDTMKRISNMCKDLKSDFMIYGEGWNMPSVLKEEDRSSLLNTDKLENIAFFNDAFRDILRGPNGNGGKGKEAGYLLGNIDYLEGFKFVFLGSSINYCFKPKFLNPNQSINYVECHDNLTLFDNFDIDYTLVPGGVGLMTVAMLMSNILKAYKRNRQEG